MALAGGAGNPTTSPGVSQTERPAPGGDITRSDRTRRHVGWLGAALALACAGCGPGHAAEPAGGSGAELAVAPGQDSRLQLLRLESRVFGNTRTLRVLVPPGYDDPDRRGVRYPVLYLNDGQNLFDARTSQFTGREWRVDETVDSLEALGRIPPLIVVGIDNAGRRGRFHEYFPWYDEYLTPPDPDPQGSRYPSFLFDEVIPFIEARYRTREAPAGRGLGGSSAGGLAALYAVVTRPGEVGRLLIESPSLYVDDYHVLRLAAGASTWPQRIYLGVGSNERGAATCDSTQAADGELVRDVRRLERVIRQGGVDPERVRVLVAPCARHDEKAWAARLPEALEFLFGPSAGAPRRGQ